MTYDENLLEVTRVMTEKGVALSEWREWTIDQVRLYFNARRRHAQATWQKLDNHMEIARQQKAEHSVRFVIPFEG